MRIFVLNILIYYTFFLTSYAKVIAVLHFPYTFCKTCPNLSFLIFLTGRCSNITTSEEFYFLKFLSFSFDFLKLKWRYTGGVEFENCPIVPVCVCNRDYRSDPFSPGSWHEPVLKVPGLTPACHHPFSTGSWHEPVLKVQHEPALMHSRSNRH